MEGNAFGEKKRIWAKGLLVDCPFEITLEDCPLKETREMSRRKQLDIINEMPALELDNLLSYHWKCQEARKASSRPSW